MNEEIKERIIDEKDLNDVSGGVNAQTQEIIDYVKQHDPNGYAFIYNSKRPMEWTLLRYLVDKGVPILTMSEYDDSNIYRIGDMDNDQRISHSELMELIKKYI
ncbi:MAG: hypothetical protein J6Z03_04145 [Erysipelotrichaceae bacterium]|nr:hypothetical protein [Erysipelotrichaceae bacterium]